MPRTTTSRDVIRAMIREEMGGEDRFSAARRTLQEGRGSGNMKGLEKTILKIIAKANGDHEYQDSLTANAIRKALSGMDDRYYSEALMKLFEDIAAKYRWNMISMANAKSAVQKIFARPRDKVVNDWMREAAMLGAS